MPETQYIHTDGTPVRSGICMKPDHWVQTFTLTVRSNTIVSAARLKDIVQAHHEVTSIERTGDVCIVANGK